MRAAMAGPRGRTLPDWEGTARMGGCTQRACWKPSVKGVGASGLSVLDEASPECAKSDLCISTLQDVARCGTGSEVGLERRRIGMRPPRSRNALPGSWRRLTLEVLTLISGTDLRSQSALAAIRTQTPMWLGLDTAVGSLVASLVRRACGPMAAWAPTGPLAPRSAVRRVNSPLEEARFSVGTPRVGHRSAVPAA
jgi:hypothetical protein